MTAIKITTIIEEGFAPITSVSLDGKKLQFVGKSIKLDSTVITSIELDTVFISEDDRIKKRERLYSIDELIRMYYQIDTSEIDYKDHIEAFSSLLSESEDHYTGISDEERLILESGSVTPKRTYKLLMSLWSEYEMS